MSELVEIRHHIKAVEDTRKITRAMYLISSAKVKRATKLHDQNALSFERVRSEIRLILDSIHSPLRNPFFGWQGDKTAYLVIAGDKGLCGGYNHEVFKLADRVMAETPPELRSLFTIGHMAAEYFQWKGMNPDVHYLHAIQEPTLRHARSITSELCWLFSEKILDNVIVVFTQLNADGTMKPTAKRLLPIFKEDFSDAAPLEPTAGALTYHPSRDEALDMMVTHYLIGWTFSAIAQSHASEHFARMTAMYSATHNADDMLQKLNIQRSHARQQAITEEIIEIVSGAAGLMGGA